MMEFDEELPSTESRNNFASGILETVPHTLTTEGSIVVPSWLPLNT